MTAPDYREQARALVERSIHPLRGECFAGTHVDASAATDALTEALAAWASRIAEERDALLREAVEKNGPRAHLPYCPASFAVPMDCDCWLGRARRLLGEGR